MDKLCEVLHVDCAGRFWITDMTLTGWGAEITFLCAYQPPESDARIPFRLALADCREIQWRVYTHGRPPAEIVNIRLGTSQHRKPLNLLTDSFGLTALYGDLKIISNEF